MGRWLRRLLVLGAASALLGVATLAGLYFWFVVQNPGEHVQRDQILAVISQESPVYYADGTSKLGVFFAEEHRQYVPFDAIPTRFVEALVAAEDQAFWEHHGISPQGIFRAMFFNLRAGRVVAGGSTLTQQTAKNIFKRRGRTWREKLRELANALRLERYFSKEDILEFYSNQFYVNGNGRGVAIAARFFFDKDLAELDLLECAFLAGVVKSPNRYNPWVAGEDRADRARAKARERADYVLGRMHAEGSITAEELAEATSREIPFSRGRFRFDRSVVLDAVERELEGPVFQRVLAENGVSDLGRSGVSVVTTVDRTVQEAAFYGLRHQLTEVGWLLEAPEIDVLFSADPRLRPADPDTLRPHTFHDAVLLSVDPEQRTARVDLGGIEGELDADAHERLATAIKKAAGKNTWAQASRGDVRALVEQLGEHVGEGISVSVRAHGGDQLLLDWEWRPELQGAVVVLEDGEVRGAVGGSTNTDFNRAMARRQLGSTWKLLLFEAALQLRWSMLDELDNRRAVFPYQATFYYPRPDHKDAPDLVSMAWAATKSENLASVWLLYHLCDRLNPEQFRQVAAQIGLAPEAGEERASWIARVQKAGVLPTEAKLLGGLFDRARQDVAVDLAFDGLDGQATALAGLHYGLGVAAERERLVEDREITAAERATRLAALDRSFLRQVELATRFEAAASGLLQALRDGGDAPAEALAGFSWDPAAERPRLSFGDTAPAGFEPLDSPALRLLAARSGEPEVAAPDEPDAVDRLFEDPPEPDEPPAGWNAFAAVQLLDPRSVLLEGQLSPDVVARLQTALRRERAELGDVQLYDFDTLAAVRDFRTLVGLRYVQALGERSGVRSPIAPVLSMPLGSSDITLFEAAQLYSVMLTGRTSRFYADALAADPAELPAAGDLPPVPRPDELPATSLIREIRLADGRVIYRSARADQQVQDASITGELGSMLRSVVAFGTGQRAEGRILPHSDDPARAKELRGLGVKIPLFGKTGTTNSYKNSAFVGVVPTVPEGDDRLVWGSGMVVAAYVGYDDNREMKRGSIRIAGASGSLPAWMAAAQGVADAAQIGDRISLADAAFGGGGLLPVSWPEGFVPVTVDLRAGLPSEQAEGVVRLLRRAEPRAFAPFRPASEDAP